MKRLVILLSLLLAAPVLADDDDLDWPVATQLLIAANQAPVDAPDPLALPMTVCLGTACEARTPVALSPEEAAAVRRLFSEPAASAAQERDRLGTAVALFETFVGVQNGTWRDHPRNEHIEGEEGQLDCISEATNTTIYLKRLEAAGLLSHHRVGGFRLRFWVILQHVAMEIVEIATEEPWVVDSWVGANGEEPEIVPYADWRMELLV